MSSYSIIAGLVGVITGLVGFFTAYIYKRKADDNKRDTDALRKQKEVANEVDRLDDDGVLDKFGELHEKRR